LENFFVHWNLGVEVEHKMDEPIQLPIDGVLDLHTFRSRDVKDLVPDYLAACRERGVLQVRIIHGKGIGHLRRTVQAILEKHPAVVVFTLDHSQYGGWGATLVQLRPAAEGAPDQPFSGQ
jgi:DNA-nicking Smr family endonuclease